jgi:uncharacterized protein DUF4157
MNQLTAPTREPAHRPPAPAPRPRERDRAPVEELGRLGRAAGNRAVGLLLDSSSGAESRANQAEQRALRAGPGPSGPLVVGGGQLTDAGRRYFEPLVGGPLNGVAVHRDGGSARLLARSRALSYGRHVVLPTGLDPETVDGRALLAHELAHVVATPSDPPVVSHKDGVEPHYPTEAEQRELARALGRPYRRPTPTAGSPAAASPTAATGSPTQAAPEPAGSAGRTLDGAARTALASRLKEPLFDTLDTLASDVGTASVSEESAFLAVQKAVDAVYDHFGDYLTVRTTLTTDARTTAEQRKATPEGQVLVTFTPSDTLATSTIATLIETHCRVCREALDGLDRDSKDAVVDALITTAFAERGDQVRRVAKANTGGAYSGQRQDLFINLRVPGTYQGTYETAVHELLHRVTHPAFTAVFVPRYRAVVEGFTEYFTKQIVGPGPSGYGQVVLKVKDALGAVYSPFLFSSVTEASEESLRRAYFQGRLDLIGWVPMDDREREAVTKARGSQPWDPAVARRKALEYPAEFKAEQAAHPNLLGIGLYFPARTTASARPTVRYARVFAQETSYARWRALLEGHLVGPPIHGPLSVAAGVGVAGEYQEPRFHVGVGARVVGDVAGTGAGRDLGVMPFAFAGVRAWQRIQIGAEGFVLVPVLGDQPLARGVGATVGVEF